MPLSNMIVMCGDTSPIVVSFCDCTDHMTEGEKKDTSYIVDFLECTKLTLMVETQMSTSLKEHLMAKFYAKPF